MPFSRAKKITFIRNATLQVRILLRQTNTIAVSFPRRSGKKACLSASLTLEAAMSLTLLIFASFCLILPLKVMDTERKIQAAPEAVGEDLSRYAYVTETLKTGETVNTSEMDSSGTEIVNRISGGASVVYAQLQVNEHVDTDAVRGLNLLRSQILEDGETIALTADYGIQLPFPVLGLPMLIRTAGCTRRAWIGLPGKTYGNDGQAGASEDTIVYLGKNSTRYHLSPTCHYLANDLKVVAADQITELRNSSGKRYHACAVCGDVSATTVYVMPSGERYHTSRNCRAIVAYVRTARLSEVAYLGACSYCGK